MRVYRLYDDGTREEVAFEHGTPERVSLCFAPDIPNLVVGDDEEGYEVHLAETSEAYHIEFRPADDPTEPGDRVSVVNKRHVLVTEIHFRAREGES